MANLAMAGRPPGALNAGGSAESRGAGGNIEQLVMDLNNPATRETALLELSKKREQFPGKNAELGPGDGAPATPLPRRQRVRGGPPLFGSNRRI